MISALVLEVAVKCAAIKFDGEVDEEVLAGAGCMLSLSAATASLLTKLPSLKHWNCILVAFHLVFVTISCDVLFDGTNSHITQRPLFVLFLADLAFESGICVTNLQPVFIGRIFQPDLFKESLFRYFLFPKKKKYMNPTKTSIWNDYRFQCDTEVFRTEGNTEQ